jgi:hypothetical protein
MSDKYLATTKQELPLFVCLLWRVSKKNIFLKHPFFSVEKISRVIKSFEEIFCRL